MINPYENLIHKVLINNQKYDHSILHSSFTMQNNVTDKKHCKVKQANFSMTACLITNWRKKESQKGAKIKKSCRIITIWCKY